MKFMVENGAAGIMQDGMAALWLARPGGDVAVGLLGERWLVAAADKIEASSRCLARDCMAEGLAVFDRMAIISPAIVRAERIWTNTGVEPITFSPAFECITGFSPTFYLIPCVNYNGNRAGSGGEPKGLLLDGKPWTFSYERTGLPGATFSEDARIAAGLFASAEDAQSLRCACSMEPVGEGMAHRLVWPPRETPLVYSDTDEYAPAAVRELTLAPGGSFRAVFFLYVAKVDGPNTGWFRAYDEALALFAPAIEARTPHERVWELGIGYLKDSLWVDDDAFTGFSIGLLPGGVHSRGAAGKQWKQRTTYRYEIGWAGQNFTNAVLLIHDYLDTGNADSLDRAEKCISRWCGSARAANGLFHVVYDGLLVGNGNPVVDTCNLGWGALMAMNAYELCLGIGREHADWLDMGLKCCDFFAGAWERHGTLGKAWRLDGMLAEPGTTVGAFMIPAFLKAYGLTGRRDYLQVAEEAFTLYRQDLDAMACNGGALDTSCIDAETTWPLFAAALDLYDLTGSRQYLDAALKAGYYTLSWVFHYDIPPDSGSDFEALGFRSAGASGVSAQHHHLHFGALYYVAHWIRLGELTGDSRWARRARMVWASSLRVISDGTLAHHGMTRPPGSENEAFMQCDWGTGENGGVKHYANDWLVVWPCTFRLINLVGQHAPLVRRALEGGGPSR